MYGVCTFRGNMHLCSISVNNNLQLLLHSTISTIRLSALSWKKMHKLLLTYHIVSFWVQVKWIIKWINCFPFLSGYLGNRKDWLCQKDKCEYAIKHIWHLPVEMYSYHRVYSHKLLCYTIWRKISLTLILLILFMYILE